MKVTQIINVRRMGFLGLLTLMFIFLKLTALSATVAAWSWWWVLSPLWLPWVAVVGFILSVALVLFIGACFIDGWTSTKGYQERKKEKRRQIVENAMRKR